MSPPTATATTAMLSRVLDPDRPGGRLVAFGRGGERRLLDLRADVASLADAVEKEGAGRWLLDVEDAYDAAVGLLAVAAAGGVAVLPPDRAPGTLERLLEDAVGAIAEPGREAALARGRPVLAARGAPRGPARAVRLPRERPFAEFTTSGTTGPGRRVTKALRHLEDEVAVLEEVLGPELPAETRIHATVSHRHIYGLLFRILWPLAAGRPFQSDPLLHAREILPRMLEGEGAALVTTPVHLSRMVASGELGRARSHCRAVFSSGSPLGDDTARRCAEQLGRGAHEILGSTETGGVARRRFPERAWTPLPRVRVAMAPDGERLDVVSPFVSEGPELPSGERRFTLGDRAAVAADGSFRLLGRADRVVKIGAKRLSLPELEACLARHPAVAEAAALARPVAGETRVHAAVVLSAAGRARLRDEGRRALGRLLADHLAARLDPVFLPRVWRYVDALPRNAQGKLPRGALERLFDAGVRDPLPLGESRGPGWLERRLRVPDDLAFLEGHFEGRPLVAGVVQLRWALDAAGHLLGRAPRVRGIEALKFPAVLLPGQDFALRVELAGDGKRLRFRLAHGERVFASGRLRPAKDGADER